MKKFESPEVEIIRFAAKDILTASGGGGGEDTEEDLVPIQNPDR